MRKTIFLLCFLAFLVWFANLKLHPDSFNIQDAAVYADIARNISTGHGAVSNVLEPIFFTKAPASMTPWPSLYPQFYPLILSLGFLVLGISENTSFAVNGFFYIATIPLLYLLAAKLFSKKVAILASLWYILNPSLLEFSISGMSESLFIFLIVSSVYLLFLKRIFWLFSAGILIGLAYLTRHQGALVLLGVLPFLLLGFKGTNRIKGTIIVLAGFILPVILSKLWLAPMILDYENIQNNNIWNLLATDAIFPVTSLADLPEPVTFLNIINNLNLVFKKIAINFFHFWQGLFLSTTPILIGFYILSLFLSLSLSRKARQLKVLTIFLLILFITFHLVTVLNFRYLLPLLPLVIILSSHAFLSIIEKFNPKHVLLSTGIFTLLFIVIPLFTSPGYGTSVERAFAKPRKPTVLYLLGEIVRENTPKEAIIATDQAPHVAWYADRKSISLPRQPDTLPKIDKKFPIGVLFLSSYFPEHYPAWQNLVENPRDFGDFKFVKSFEIKPEDNYYRIPIKAVLYTKKAS